MRRKKAIFLVFLFVLILSACLAQKMEPSPIKGENEAITPRIIESDLLKSVVTATDLAEGGAFELHLLADPQLAGVDVLIQELDGLPLAEEPLISTQDLIRYNWEDHSFEVTEEVYSQLFDLFSKNVSVSGLPFVILSKGERLYAGVFGRLPPPCALMGLKYCSLLNR